MLARLTLAATDPTKDARLAGVIDDLVADYDELCAEQPPGRLPDAVDDIGFLIEELRVQTGRRPWGLRSRSRRNGSARRCRRPALANPDHRKQISGRPEQLRTGPARPVHACAAGDRIAAPRRSLSDLPAAPPRQLSCWSQPGQVPR
jgi:hypothetical protein